MRLLKAAEVGTTQLRERTIALATTCGFLVSLVITYVNPFVQNEPGNLGSKVGMIYGGVSILSLVFVFFVVPEMKKRSLEELDDMFHSGVPAWRSSSFVSSGVGAQITNMEGMNIHGEMEYVAKDVEDVESEKPAKLST